MPRRTMLFVRQRWHIEELNINSRLTNVCMLTGTFMERLSVVTIHSETVHTIFFNYFLYLSDFVRQNVMYFLR